VNYKKHYDALIERARHRVLEGYFEKHHVLPKCLGGGDDTNNIVKLTAEEHYVAHQLLVKLNPGNSSLIYAACVMTQSPIGKRINNKLYGWLKRELSKLQSKKFLGKVWTNKQNTSRSETLKRQWADPDFRTKRSQAMRGRTWTEESKDARSAMLRGKPGRKWTDEQKIKVSETKRKNHLLKGAVKND
jgi:hypothetical protein